MNSKYTSKKSFLNNSNVDKRFLGQYVLKKINKSIPLYHIAAIINILFDELLIDVIAGKYIIIGNFGKFFLKQMLPRKYHDWVENKMKISKGNLILRFRLNKDFNKILINNLDLAKTFGDNQNG